MSLSIHAPESTASGAVCKHALVPYAKMPIVYSAADVFVLPSVCDDAAPLSIKEAMAVGLPVIGTRVGGITEAISEGGTGFVVSPGDPEALGQVIRQLLDNASLRDTMRENALLQVKAYSWTHIADQVEEIYEKVLSHDDLQ